MNITIYSRVYLYIYIYICIQTSKLNTEYEAIDDVQILFSYSDEDARQSSAGESVIVYTYIHTYM